MPTYTYRCQRCGEEFERFQSMSDPPVKRCPTCKGKVQRTFHPVGIVLKGSGFHKTDYLSPSQKSDRETKSSEAKGEPKDAKGEPSKKDSKPSESKSDSKKDTKASSGSSQD